MSGIVIKTEKLDEDELKEQLNNEDGVESNSNSSRGGGDDGGAAAVGSVIGTPKGIEEKTQTALKVALEAKQLRLKDQYLLQQPIAQKNPQQHQQQQTLKRTNTTSAELLQAVNDSNNEQHPQQLPPYKVGSKRFRVQTPQNYVSRKHNNSTPPPLLQRPHKRPPMGSMSLSRCGEIFVTNNARKWTFVCTFCQKTTRDIGEFVCHIKYKHMPEQYHEDDNEEDYYDNEEHTTEMYNNHNPDDSYNNHDQDYFDCASYLDVNVHTESDEMPPNNGVPAKGNLKPPSRTTNNTKDPIGKHIPTTKNKYVVDLLDDDEEQTGNNNENVRGGGGDDCIKKSQDEMKTELFDYEMDEDEEGVEMVEDDNYEMEGVDDDNLLFLRSNSIDETVAEGVNCNMDGKGIKKYRSHVRGKAYCNLCDKTFQYYSLYRNHMIKHSNITPYKCQYCSKAFKSKQAIRYHMNTHTKEVQYNCPLCPMTYGTENQFITHVLNHESDTCFPCMVCAKICNSDQEREEHLSTHSEERPYSCNFCNKRFRQKHHLSNHLKLHCQYRCDFCKEEFSSTQTQRRPYACATCEEYPHIRLQVEKQRSKSLNNSEVNPLDISYEQNQVEGNEATECVDLATDEEDDESETSTSLLAGGNNSLTASGGSGAGGLGGKRIPCQYCTRSYKQTSALNYHMRQKHPQIWAELNHKI